MECELCTVGYPSRVAKTEGKETPCILKEIRNLQRNDGQPDMSRPEQVHKRPDGVIGEEPTLICRECPKRCGQEAVHAGGLNICRKHLKECGYGLPSEFDFGLGKVVSKLRTLWEKAIKNNPLKGEK